MDRAAITMAMAAIMSDPTAKASEVARARYALFAAYSYPDS